MDSRKKRINITRAWLTHKRDERYRRKSAAHNERQALNTRAAELKSYAVDTINKFIAQGYQYLRPSSSSRKKLKRSATTYGYAGNTEENWWHRGADDIIKARTSVSQAHWQELKERVKLRKKQNAKTDPCRYTVHNTKTDRSRTKQRRKIQQQNAE